MLAERVRRHVAAALLADLAVPATGLCEDAHGRLLHDDVAPHLLHDAPAGLQIDYLELVDRENLQLLPKVAGPALLAAAVYYDDVRLIDNVEI